MASVFAKIPDDFKLHFLPHFLGLRLFFQNEMEKFIAIHLSELIADPVLTKSQHRHYYFPNWG